MLLAPLNALPCLTGVGSKGFVEKSKAALGIRAKGRRVRGREEAYELREPEALYADDFEVKNDDIGVHNIYFWDIKPE